MISDNYISRRAMNNKLEQQLKREAKNKGYSEAIANCFIVGKVLDIGFAARPLSNKSLEIHGTDIMPVSKPSNYKETHIVNLNTSPIPYENKFFDTVYIGFTLACFGNPLRVLCESNRVLKEDGICIITLTNPSYYLDVLQNIFIKKYSIVAFQKFYSFTRCDMRSVTKRANFEVVTEYGTYFRIPIIGIKLFIPRLPALSDQIVYILKKKEDIKRQSITVSRTYSDKDKPKEFEIDADLF
jgi:SAM-dependent methyltransferase